MWFQEGKHSDHAYQIIIEHATTENTHQWLTIASCTVPILRLFVIGFDRDKYFNYQLLLFYPK